MKEFVTPHPFADLITQPEFEAIASRIDRDMLLGTPSPSQIREPANEIVFNQCVDMTSEFTVMRDLVIILGTKDKQTVSRILEYMIQWNRARAAADK